MRLSASKGQGETKEDILYQNRRKSSQKLELMTLGYCTTCHLFQGIKYQIQRRYLNASYIL
jgi:hypothetical protein